MIDQEKPQIVVIDSIQTMYREEITSAPGSVSQVRESTGVLMQIAKSRGIAIFVVGHGDQRGSSGRSKGIGTYGRYGFCIFERRQACILPDSSRSEKSFLVRRMRLVYLKCEEMVFGRWKIHQNLC